MEEEKSWLLQINPRDALCPEHHVLNKDGRSMW